MYIVLKWKYSKCKFFVVLQRKWKSASEFWYLSNYHPFNLLSPCRELNDCEEIHGSTILQFATYNSLLLKKKFYILLDLRVENENNKTMNFFHRKKFIFFTRLRFFLQQSRGKVLFVSIRHHPISRFFLWMAIFYMSFRCVFVIIIFVHKKLRKIRNSERTQCKVKFPLFLLSSRIS